MAKRTAKGKKKPTRAERIRRAAQAILAEAGGKMILTDLQEEVAKVIGGTIRRDYLVSCLSTTNSGFEVSTFAVLTESAGKEQVSAPPPQGEKRLTVKEFVLRALEMLPTKDYRGFHVVYSGFNQAFRKYFPGKDPVKEVRELVEQGVVHTRPVKGGVMIYPGPAKDGERATPDGILTKMDL